MNLFPNTYIITYFEVKVNPTLEEIFKIVLKSIKIIKNRKESLGYS